MTVEQVPGVQFTPKGRARNWTLQNFVPLINPVVEVFREGEVALDNPIPTLDIELYIRAAQLKNMPTRWNF